MLGPVREQITGGLHGLSTREERSAAIVNEGMRSAVRENLLSVVVLTEIVIQLLGRFEDSGQLWESLAQEIAAAETEWEIGRG